MNVDPKRRVINIPHLGMANLWDRDLPCAAAVLAVNQRVHEPEAAAADLDLENLSVAIARLAKRLCHGSQSSMVISILPLPRSATKSSNFRIPSA